MLPAPVSIITSSAEKKPVLTTLMVTSQAAFDHFAGLFPDFPSYWEWDDGWREKDGSFTLCGLFFGITDFIRDRIPILTEPQVRAFGDFVNNYFWAGEEARGALGACLIEPLDYPENRDTIFRFVVPEVFLEESYWSEEQHQFYHRAKSAPKKPLDPQAVAILELCEPSENTPREICKNPDPAVINKTVKDQEWSDITFVVLKFDDNNWIEGSGSLNPRDGLSARYSKDGEEHVSSRPPKSLEEIIALLQSFLSGDGRWQKMIDWE